MNTLGLDVNAVGNHEFDEGYRELQRMQYGGCIDDGNGANNQNSCPAGVFQGANFDLLAANVFYAGSNRTILPAYTIKKVHGAKIGFIGMTLKDTPSIVTASGVQGLEFKDEVATANALVPVLRRQGVKAIIVLIHQGGVPDKQQWTDPSGKTWAVNPNYDYACGGGGSLIAASSPILGIADSLSLARALHHVLFVGRLDRLTLDTIFDAREMLDRFDTEPVGMVVVGARGEASPYYLTAARPTLDES